MRCAPDAERVARETSVSQANADQQALNATRQKAQERFQQRLMEEVQHLREQLEEERRIREEAETNLLHAIDEVVHGLQGGMHIIS